MPSSNHIVVVQDLTSQYPAAKIVSSTKASKVIPALADIETMPMLILKHNFQTMDHPSIQQQ